MNESGAGCVSVKSSHQCRGGWSQDNCSGSDPSGLADRISSAARPHEKAAAFATAFSQFPVARMERSAILATNLFLPLAVLHAKRLVAAAAFLADRGEIRLERVQILDLALGLANDLGEARDLGIESGFVLPHFRRGAVVALGLHALCARRKQLRQLLCGR